MMMTSVRSMATSPRCRERTEPAALRGGVSVTGGGGIFNIYIYICIHIYVYRERERKRERDR